MGSLKILVPYNFTDHDKKALDFVHNTFAHLPEAGITIFHAYTPAPALETPDSAVTGKLKSSMGYLNQKIMQQGTELEEVKNQLIQSGLSGSRLDTVYKPRKKDVAAEIIDLAKKEDFNIIVINHRPGRATRFFSASVHNKVISGIKNITVCLVS